MKKHTHTKHSLPPLDPRVLRNVVESYDGETLQVPQCDSPVFHGYGTAVFRTGFTYSGDFFLGRMHGCGRIQWTSGVIFEGDFIDNEMQGKGTYTWPNGSSYTGDITKGKRHGDGVFVCGTRGAVELNDNSEDLRDEGNENQTTHFPGAPLRFSYNDTTPSDAIVDATSSARYEGQWLDGFPHGRGVLVFDDELNVRYEGEFVRGKRHGYGEMRYASGNVYVGQWAEDTKCGHGTILWMAESRSGQYVAVEKYDGEWKDDRPYGHGRHVWIGSSSKRREKNWYEGSFENGVRHGLGVFFYANGARYEGEWVENVKHGRGVFYYEDGRVFAGEFRDDRPLDSGESLATGKILLFVDDLLPRESRDKARKLIEHAVLRLNTELRALYRQYIAQSAPSSPTRLSVTTSPTKPPSGVGEDGADGNAMLMEYYECRQLLGDSGMRLTSGHLEHVLGQVREAHRLAAGDDIGKPAIALTDAVTLAETMPEVVPPSRLLLYREFVELLVRLAHEQRCSDAEDSDDTLLADAFAHFMEQLARERQLALKTNESLTPTIWTSLQQLYAKELHSVYQKHHHTFRRLFLDCQRPHTTESDEDNTMIPQHILPTVSVRSVMAILQSLGLFSSEFRLRHALFALQEALLDDSSEQVDPFFVSTELAFADFLDAIAIVLMARQQHASSQSRQLFTPVFALVDEFIRSQSQ